MAYCYVWDLTIPEGEFSRKGLQRLFEEHAKKWCFQLEEGENTGYLHYQCRISTIMRCRLSNLTKIFGSSGHYTPTAESNSKNDFYVTKVETRVKGPWSNSMLKIPKWLRETPTWYRWQKSVLRKIGVSCEGEVISDNNNENRRRVVNVVIDTIGKNGKTTLGMWLLVRGLAMRLPMLNDTKDMSRAILDMKKQRTYIFDIPRATDKKFMRNFWAAMEELKNGYAYDDRHSFRYEIFEPPHVWIFTNSIPDVSTLTSDRWNLWTITKELRLVPFVEKEESDDLDV